MSQSVSLSFHPTLTSSLSSTTCGGASSGCEPLPGTYHFWGMFREPLPGERSLRVESPTESNCPNQHVLLPESCHLSASAHLGCFPDQAPRVGNRAPPELTVAPLYLRIAGRLSQPCWLVCVVHDTQKEKGKVPSHCFGAITKLVKHIISPQSTRQARMV